jgi:hypothetical protein
MKYYCKECKSELRTDVKNFSGFCPICSKDERNRTIKMIPIPDYETLKQYKERTGQASLPNDTPVWVSKYRQDIFSSTWQLYYLHEVDLDNPSTAENKVLIADSIIPPDWDYEPEEDLEPDRRE